MLLSTTGTCTSGLEGAVINMLRHCVLLALLGGSAGLNITTTEKLLWMEFPELLTVVSQARACCCTALPALRCAGCW